MVRVQVLEYHNGLLRTSKQVHFLIKNSFYKKLVVAQPNGSVASVHGSVAFSTEATEAKNFYFILSFSCHNFEDKITNFGIDMFRKQSDLQAKLQMFSFL